MKSYTVGLDVKWSATDYGVKHNLVGETILASGLRNETSLRNWIIVCGPRIVLTGPMSLPKPLYFMR